MNSLTRKELKQLIKKHGYIEVTDSKNYHIRSYIYINNKGKMKIKLPNGNDINIK